MKPDDFIMKILRFVYDKLLRNFLPEKISVHNGVPVAGYAKLLDFNDQKPYYEEALISAVRSEAESGNKVTIVGGGLGVSGVVAGQQVGESGVVEIFEGSDTQVEIISKTIALNQLDDRISIRDSFIGSVSEYSKNKYGGDDTSNTLPPSELSECNMLVLDCEGAEKEIIPSMTVSPETIIVETHGFLGSGKDIVQKLLDQKGYEIVDIGTEDSKKGVFIITAKNHSIDG
jgi:ribose 5-phosphate isomerase RpiB